VKRESSSSSAHWLLQVTSSLLPPATDPMNVQLHVSSLNWLKAFSGFGKISFFFDQSNQSIYPAAMQFLDGS